MLKKKIKTMKKIKIKNTILITILSGMLLGGPVFANESLLMPQKESQASEQTLVKMPKKDLRVFERTFSTPKKTKKFAIDEIIVKFKEDKKPFQVIKVPKGKVLKEVEKYEKRDDVIYAEPNYIVQTSMMPNDDYYELQWHLDNSTGSGVNAEKAWDISNGSGVVVAVIDTGIAYEDNGRYAQAPDLAETCFVKGYDFVNNDDHPNDDNSHGTHVAGTIAQSTNNNLGVAGLAYGACLMPVKVLDDNGYGYVDDVANGIIFAADNEAQVINLSLSGEELSTTLENAVAHAYNEGVTIIASAGNDSSSVIGYPAAYNDYVIAVGATRYDKALSYYSNYGSDLDLVAPGGDMTLDQNGDGYGDGVLQQTFKSPNFKVFGYWFFQGTSMAAPHVAGAVALLIASENATTPDEIRNVLQSNAQDLGAIGRDDIYGYGLLDTFAALQNSSTMEHSGFFDNEDSKENICAAGTLDFDLSPSEIGIVLTGELMNININNKDGNLPFEYQVRTKTSEEHTLCEDLDVSVTIDGLGCYFGKLNDFVATASMSDLQDGWEFIITDSANNSPGETCNFEFIFEGWQKELNFNQGFTDIESALGTVELVAGSQTEEIFLIDTFSEVSPNETTTEDYSEEESNEIAIEESLEDNSNDTESKDKNEDRDNPETSSDIKNEEKIITPKQENLPDDDDLDDDLDDENEPNLNKNSVDCVQIAE